MDTSVNSILALCQFANMDAEELAVIYARMPIAPPYDQYFKKDGSWKIEQSKDNVLKVLQTIGVECERDMQHINYISSMIAKYLNKRKR